MKSVLWDSLAIPSSLDIDGYRVLATASPPVSPTMGYDLGCCLHLQNLLVLSLDFSLNKGLRSLDALADSVARMPCLQEVRVLAHFCKQIESIEVLSEGLGSLTDLRILEIGFGCTAVRSVEPLAQVLSKQRSLKELTLDFANCDNPFPIGRVLHAIQSNRLLHNLEKLELDFSQKIAKQELPPTLQNSGGDENSNVDPWDPSGPADGSEVLRMEFLPTKLLQNLKILRVRLNGRSIASLDGLVEAFGNIQLGRMRRLWGWLYSLLPRPLKHGRFLTQELTSAYSGNQFDVLELSCPGSTFVCNESKYHETIIMFYETLSNLKIRASSLLLKFPGTEAVYSIKGIRPALWIAKGKKEQREQFLAKMFGHSSHDSYSWLEGRGDQDVWPLIDDSDFGLEDV
eukprot:Sro1361_g266160.2  (400) ;mRNA; f:2887-4086